MNRSTKGPNELRDEVLSRGLCTVCGMCIGLCPYLQEMGENVAFISDCKQTEGRCFKVCPRTEVDLHTLRNILAKAPYQDPLLGPFIDIFMSRSARQPLRRRGQYGATVTTLLMYALQTKRIDSALLARWSSEGDPLLARPFLAKNPNEIMDGAGSKYTACPSLKLLNEPMDQVQKLALVGRPCQIVALRKRQQLEDLSFPREKIALVIGLFCMWSLSYRTLHRYLKRDLKGKKIKKMDIPKGRFLLMCGSKRLEFPHDQIRALSRETCRRCFDFTAELADLSVGSTEWKADWNTLIIRSEAAKELVDDACREGWIEIKPFPEEKLAILREASRNKKLKALELIEHEEKEQGVPSYLHVDEAEKRIIKNG